MANYMTEIELIKECGQRYKCIDCGEDFVYLGSGTLRKPRCDECNIKIRKQRWREASKKWRWTERGIKYNNERAKKKKNPLLELGTTNVGSHFCGDFEREQKIITHEMRKLHFKKKV